MNKCIHKTKTNNARPARAWRRTALAAAALATIVTCGLHGGTEVSCAHAGCVPGAHGSDVQGDSAERRWMAGGQSAGCDAAGEVVGGIWRSGTECAGGSAEYQQPEHQGVLRKLYGSAGAGARGAGAVFSNGFDRAELQSAEIFVESAELDGCAGWVRRIDGSWYWHGYECGDQHWHGEHTVVGTSGYFLGA